MERKEDPPGHLEEIELLGPEVETAHGRILRAHDRATGEDVAVRVNDPAGTEGLEHPFILQMIHPTSPEGEHREVTEWAGGEPFSRLLAEGKLTMREGVQILERVARAIGYAHERGRVHRGLGGDDIMVGAEGVPKVSGFRERREDDDPREDVRSLGLLLGGLPGVGVTPDLKKLSLRCLESDPELRYGSIPDLENDLDRFLNGRTLRGVRLGTAQRFLRKVKRFRMGFFVAASAAAIAGLFYLHALTRGWIGTAEEAGFGPVPKTVVEQEASPVAGPEGGAVTTAAPDGVTSLTGSSGEGSLRTKLREARSAWSDGDLEMALNLADNAIASVPAPPDWYMLRGDIHLERGEALKAAQDYRAGMEGEVFIPLVSDPFLNRLRKGAFHYVKGELEEALDWFGMALEDGDDRARYWRALTMHREGRAEEARREMEVFLEHYPLEGAREFLSELK